MSALADRLLALPESDRRELLVDLSPDDLLALQFQWEVWARHDQLPPPGAWRIWALIAGRGAGKTRSAAEWVRSNVEAGRRRSIGIIGPTADTLRRDVVEGESGLLRIAPPWCTPQHEPSQRRIVWPNGAVAYLLSTEEPDRIRGVNLDCFWGDELTSWNKPGVCYDNLQFALRIRGPMGDAPAGVISTTPKRHALLKLVLADPATVVTRASTFDNAANLDPAALDFFRRRYEGTTLGRQELYAEVLDDIEGAMWNRDMLDKARVQVEPETFKRVVVAIDPAGASHKGSAETGIVAAGLGQDGHIYVLRDNSGRYSPEGWAARATQLYEDLKANYIVVEKNFGGEMVTATLKATGSRAKVRVVTASRGKAIRAEPVVGQYEQGRVHHVGVFPELEDQLCSWDPTGNDPSPDRLDALVWAVTELTGRPPMRINPAELARISAPGHWHQPHSNPDFYKI